jgi:hypothetical protein
MYNKYSRLIEIHRQQSCMNLERTKYHAVDAGFWIVLELIIRWISFRFNLIGLSPLAMFVRSPWNRFDCTAVFGYASMSKTCS